MIIKSKPPVKRSFLFPAAEAKGKLAISNDGISVYRIIYDLIVSMIW